MFHARKCPRGTSDNAIYVVWKWFVSPVPVEGSGVVPFTVKETVPLTGSSALLILLANSAKVLEAVGDAFAEGPSLPSLRLISRRREFASSITFGDLSVLARGATLVSQGFPGRLRPEW